MGWGGLASGGQSGALGGQWLTSPSPCTSALPLATMVQTSSSLVYLLSQSVSCLSPSLLSCCSHTHFIGGSELTSFLTLLRDSQPQNPLIILAQLRGLWSALVLPDFLCSVPSFSGFCDAQGSWFPSEPVLLPVSGSLAGSSSHPNLSQPPILSLSLLSSPGLGAGLEHACLAFSSHLSSAATFTPAHLHIPQSCPQLNHFPSESSFPATSLFLFTNLFSELLSNLNIICDSALSANTQGRSIIHHIYGFPFFPYTTSAHGMKSKLLLSGNVRPHVI